MVQLANIVRKIKVFGTSIEFPQDEWEIIKELPFAKNVFLSISHAHNQILVKINCKTRIGRAFIG